jgi:glycerol-3-phosphate dehydrogenase (NAD(P)+)
VAERVCVVNAGGWGTALSALLAAKGCEVWLWARRPEMAELMASRRENTSYLPGVALAANVHPTSNLEEALRGSSVIVVTPISRAMRSVARALSPLVSPEQLVVHGSKGLDPESLMTGRQVLEEELGPAFRDRVAVISGPNHAEEVGRGIPAATVVACRDEVVAQTLQGVLATRTFRVYTNTDVLGVELCGVLKNIITLVAGMSDGLGYGDNSKAAIITRGLAEFGRFVAAMGGDPFTVVGLAGIGDIIASCTSRFSRNRAAGEAIARGKTAAEVQAATPMVIEGIPATWTVSKLAAAKGVQMPITEQLHAVLFQGISPQQGLAQLMTREFTSEPWM